MTRDWGVHWVLTVVGYVMFGGALFVAVGAGFPGIAGLVIGLLVLHTVFVGVSIYILRTGNG